MVKDITLTARMANKRTSMIATVIMKYRRTYLSAIETKGIKFTTRMGHSSKRLMATVNRMDKGNH